MSEAKWQKKLAYISHRYMSKDLTWASVDTTGLESLETVVHQENKPIILLMEDL